VALHARQRQAEIGAFTRLIDKHDIRIGVRRARGEVGVVIRILPVTGIHAHHAQQIVPLGGIGGEPAAVHVGQRGTDGRVDTELIRQQRVINEKFTEDHMGIQAGPPSSLFSQLRIKLSAGHGTVRQLSVTFGSSEILVTSRGIGCRRNGKSLFSLTRQKSCPGKSLKRIS